MAIEKQNYRHMNIVKEICVESFDEAISAVAAGAT